MADRRAIRIAEGLTEGNCGTVLRDLANEVCLSEPRFWHLFRDATGSSPRKWAMDRRLSRALKLIETTDLTIKEIAFLVEFKHQSLFTRVFRDVFGKAPLQYRRAMTGQQERAILQQERDNNRD
jgi:AraC-like DNA-binding protein